MQQSLSLTNLLARTNTVKLASRFSLASLERGSRGALGVWLVDHISDYPHPATIDYPAAAWAVDLLLWYRPDIYQRYGPRWPDRLRWWKRYFKKINTLNDQYHPVRAIQKIYKNLDGILILD